MSDKLRAILAARKAELSGAPAATAPAVSSLTPVAAPALADAPSNLSLKDKIAWLQKAKAQWQAGQSDAKTDTATATYSTTVSEVEAPDVAESPAAKTAAIVAAMRAAKGIGAAPALKAGVMPQITALELAAKKVQEREAAGTYNFKNPDAVSELELSPTLIEAKLREWDLAIETQNPEAKTLLQDINSLLRTYEELAHLMTEEQIGIVVSGALALAGTEVQTLNATKSKSSTKAANAAMSSSDF